MEVVATVSSVVTLIELAGKLSTVIGVLSKYHASKVVLDKISRNVVDLTAQLGFLKAVEESFISHNAPLSQEESAVVHTVLQAAHIDLSNAYTFCIKFVDTMDKRTTRIAWAMRDVHVWEEYASRLQQTEIRLGAIIHLVAWKSARRDQNDLKMMLEKIVDELGLVGKHLVGNDVRHCSQSQKPLENIHGPMQPQGVTRTSGKRTLVLWAKYGVQLAVLVSNRNCSKTYSLAFKALLPLLAGYTAFDLCLGLQTRLSDLPSLTCQLKCKNVIPDDAEIITACKNGNLNAVRDIFTRRESGPNDMTSDFRPLLWYAIKSGSIDIVSFLISYGADATALSGMTSAGLLHSAFYCRNGPIARLLISEGADINQVNNNGLTPIFHLFQPDFIDGETSAVEFLQILASYGFSGFNDQANSGWTPLHRAASYGLRRDVDCLLGYGALPTIGEKSQHWSPIFCAVSEDNVEIVEELASHLDPGFTSLQDARGWTLLHLAAEVGNPKMIDLLINYGSDPHAVSHTNPSFPDRMQQCNHTPADVAKEANKLGNFVIGLKLAGLDVMMTDGDIFW